MSDKRADDARPRAGVSLLRFSRRFLFWGVLGASILFLALVWFLGSESALRLAAARAEAWSDGNVRIGAVAGSLFGPLRIEELHFRTDKQAIRIRQASLDWSPRDLLRRHVHINQLSLAELRIVELKPSDEPPKLPDTLALPVSVSVPKATIDRVIFKTASGERVLSGISFSLEKPARIYTFNLHAMTSPIGDIRGQVHLAEARPFALTGKATLAHPSASATLAAGGSLENVELLARAKLGQGEAQATLALNPFSGRPLKQADVSMRNVDPTTWNKTLPRADLSLNLAFASESDNVFAGTIAARNAAPGVWNRGRLPLANFSAAISGNLEGIALSSINLDLGKAGSFTGSGRADDTGLQLSLNTSNFDPNGVHSQLRAMRLAGDIKLQADASQQTVLAKLDYQRYRIRLDALHREQTVRLNEARLSFGDSSLSLFGTLGLDASRPFDLAGALQGFDPAAFGEYPKARINASFTAAGKLLPTPQGFLRFAIADSRLRGNDLSGRGGFNLSQQRLWNSDVVLKLGSNRLQVKGAFGASGDRLDFLVQANRPELIDPAIAGTLNASGHIAGSFAAPSGEVDIEALALKWKDQYRMTRLRAVAHIPQGLEGNVRVDAEVEGLKMPRLELTRARASARGKRSQHTISVTASNKELDLAAELAGGLQGKQNTLAWSGRITKLRNAGNYALTLKSPADLEIARGRFLLANARFDFLGSAFQVQEIRYQPDQLVSRGGFENLTVAALNKLTRRQDLIAGDLSLAGEWDIDARREVGGHIALWRERGDIHLSGEPSTRLGLTALRLRAQATANRLQARLEADGDKLGRLNIDAQTQFSQRGDVWGIAGEAPLQGKADLDIQSLAWLAPFVDKTGGVRVDGALKAQVEVSGTVAEPNFTGTAAGARFRLAMPEQGLDLREGGFQAELQRETLRITSLSLRGGDGSVSGEGYVTIDPRRPEMKLSLQAMQLRAISRVDRLLIVSGTSEFSLVNNQAQLLAQLKADRGLIELAEQDTPTVSADVVVLGRSQQPSRQGLPYALSLDLRLNLGDRFFLKGRGLDAQLGGSVRLAGSSMQALNANGSIRVVNGAYSAYGQRLVIERGILNFQGPIDNPGLNVLAMRKNQEVEAGVAITGTAQSPQVRLVSTPTVPDREKLAWLVLGHGLADTGAQEFDTLQIAASALLGAGESITLQQRIAHAAGLEEVSLKGAGTLEGTVLTLGKRLSSRAYVSYEQGLTGTGTLIKINYSLTKRLSLRAQAGTTPAVDLFYTFSFD